MLMAFAVIPDEPSRLGVGQVGDALHRLEVKLDPAAPVVCIDEAGGVLPNPCYRLGVNHESLPVNRPHVPVHNYHRDGAMRFDDNSGGAVNYEPNSFGGPAEDPTFKEPPLPLSGDADRYDHRIGNDDYSQPGALFRLISPDQKQQLFDNIAAAMQGVPEAIQLRQIGHFSKADSAYGRGVAERLGLAPKFEAAD